MRDTLLALLLLGATPALASGPGETSHDSLAYLENGVLTYEIFEAAVPHVDIESCPAMFDPEVVFCRMTLAADLAHIFVFDFDGDQPLLAVKSYPLDDDFLPF